VQEIVREGHGRTPEQRQFRQAWKPEELAEKAGLDRTTITKWSEGKKIKRPREARLRQLTRAAFGSDTSDHPLAVELWSAYRARTSSRTPAADGERGVVGVEDPIVQLDDRTPFADGQFYIPLPCQRGGNPDQAPIHLRLVFPGLAKVTTKQGSVVFAVTSARLSVGTCAGRIVDHNPDVETGWTGEWTSVRAVPAAGGEIAWQITSNDLAQPLSGNVLVRPGEDPHVRLFDIPIDEPAMALRIHGRVTFDADGIRVHLRRSRLKAAIPTEQRAIETMQARLTAHILRSSGDGIVEFPEAEL
jgi:transcriptional regulator with XRE-family HTH domain